MLVECGTWAEFEITGVGLEELGLYLRELRTRKGLSMRALSRGSGVSQPYVSMIESGCKDRPPNLKVLRQLSAYFGVQVDTFLLVGGMKALPPGETPIPFRVVVLDVLNTLGVNPYKDARWLSPAMLFMLAECIVTVADGVEQPSVQGAVNSLRPFTQEKEK